MLKKLQALKAKKGFTLVELIVVIAIIGVLAAILIPTLSGVIESSRKRSAESTCSSIQNLLKTYISQYEAKTGKTLKGTDLSSAKVDMDTGDNEITFCQYLGLQIPELISHKKDQKVQVTINDKGQVTAIGYQEGSYVANWNSSDGAVGAVKNGTLQGATPVQAVAVGGGAPAGGGT